MLRRIAVVAGLCAVTLPFGGSASASCLDDLTGTYLYHSDAYWDSSDHYLNWVHADGFDVVVEGDDLLWDVDNLAGYLPEYTGDIANNVVGATGTFVTCVAG